MVEKIENCSSAWPNCLTKWSVGGAIRSIYSRWCAPRFWRFSPVLLVHRPGSSRTDIPRDKLKQRTLIRKKSFWLKNSEVSEDLKDSGLKSHIMWIQRNNSGDQRVTRIRSEPSRFLERNIYRKAYSSHENWSIFS